MRVHDIMTAHPVTAHPGDSIAHALQLMRDGGFHHLPIKSSSGHLIGIVTDKDCRVALEVPDLWTLDHKTERRAQTLKLREVMSHAPIVTYPGADVLEAGLLMYENQINCLPVMLEETLVGIMTSSDLLIAFIQLSRNHKEKL